MFLILLGVTFIIALAVSYVVTQIFTPSRASILTRIIAEAISTAWLKYLKFAIYVVGISSGVRIHELEKYITPQRWDKEMRIVELTGERWVLEIYRTVIETLQGLAWMLLAFFLFTLVIYVIIRIFETWKRKRDETKSA